jgi:hypothetical protein
MKGTGWPDAARRGSRYANLGVWLDRACREAIVSLGNSVQSGAK